MASNRDDPTDLILNFTSHFPVPKCVKESSSTFCKHCRQTFSRGHKHCCRLCGQLFCSRCTEKMHLSPAYHVKDKDKLSCRVCYQCQASCIDVKAKQPDCDDETKMRVETWSMTKDRAKEIYLPEWQLSASWVDCFKCHSTGPAKNAHHCRTCGRMHCSTCTSKLEVPPEFVVKKKTGPQRVCDHCRFLLKAGWKLVPSARPGSATKVRRLSYSNSTSQSQARGVSQTRSMVDDDFESASGYGGSKPNKPRKSEAAWPSPSSPSSRHHTNVSSFRPDDEFGSMDDLDALLARERKELEVEREKREREAARNALPLKPGDKKCAMPHCCQLSGPSSTYCTTHNPGDGGGSGEYRARPFNLEKDGNGNGSGNGNGGSGEYRPKPAPHGGPFSGLDGNGNGSGSGSGEFRAKAGRGPFDKDGNGNGNGSGSGEYRAKPVHHAHFNPASINLAQLVTGTGGLSSVKLRASNAIVPAIPSRERKPTVDAAKDTPAWLRALQEKREATALNNTHNNTNNNTHTTHSTINNNNNPSSSSLSSSSSSLSSSSSSSLSSSSPSSSSSLATNTTTTITTTTTTTTTATATNNITGPQAEGGKEVDVADNNNNKAQEEEEMKEKEKAKEGATEKEKEKEKGKEKEKEKEEVKAEEEKKDEKEEQDNKTGKVEKTKDEEKEKDEKEEEKEKEKEKELASTKPEVEDVEEGSDHEEDSRVFAEALWSDDGNPAEGELPLVKRELILVLDMSDAVGWWRGVNAGGLDGIFPYNLVRIIPRRKNPPQEAGTHILAVPPEVQEAARISRARTLTMSAASSASSASSALPSGGVHVNSVSNVSLGSPSSSGSFLPRISRSAHLPTDSASSSASFSSVGEFPVSAATAAFLDAEDSQDDDNESRANKDGKTARGKTITATSTSPSSSPVIPTSPRSMAGGVARKKKKKLFVVAIFPYHGEEADELSLEVGDRVAVMKKDPDGWWMGRNERTKNVGLFPHNFVQKEGKVAAPAAS